MLHTNVLDKLIVSKCIELIVLRTMITISNSLFSIITGRFLNAPPTIMIL